MKINLNKTAILLVVIFVAAFVIRFYQLSFFEYKNDQYFAISLGNTARAANLLITHGMLSGVGVNNPPLFLQVMGVLTSVTNDPFLLTFFFFAINILALVFALVYFYRTLPPVYTVLSSVFLALFPAFTMYSSNIWAQLFLPVLMILFNINLYKFIKSENTWYFFIAVILAVLAAQFHMSGFFLAPVLFIILTIYWNKINKRMLGLAIFLAFLLFIPYLINLFWQGEFKKFVSYGSSVERDFPWRVFPMHLRMASFDFFRSYFRRDFNGALKSIAGSWRFIFYPLTFIPTMLFVLGLFSYLRWLFKGRKLFNIDDDINQKYPLPFQISGFLMLTITLGYILFRVRTPMHYFVVLFPAYSLITGFAAIKIWKYWWGKLVVPLGIISTVVLLLATLFFLDNSGGHPAEYGVSYKRLTAWQKELQSIRPKGCCLDLKINYIGEGKTGKEAAYSILSDENKCRKGDKIIPADFNISWNNKLMRYEHSIIIKK